MVDSETCKHEWAAGPYPFLVCRRCDKTIKLVQEGGAVTLRVKGHALTGQRYDRAIGKFVAACSCTQVSYIGHDESVLRTMHDKHKRAVRAAAAR